MLQAMVCAAICDIEAIRAALPLEKRRHSEIVLRHLRLALADLGRERGLDRGPAGVPAGVVVRLDAARRARVAAAGR